jgi:hypothetical protein
MVATWMAEAQDELLKKVAARKRPDPQSALLKGAVFYWTCQILEVRALTREMITDLILSTLSSKGSREI